MYNDPDKSFNREYSLFFELLILWGQKTCHEESCKDIEDQWSAIFEPTNIEADISNDLKRIEKKIEDSIKVISSKLTLDINHDDVAVNEFAFLGLEEDYSVDLELEPSRPTLFFKISDAFNNFDDLVYLQIALKNCNFLKHLPKILIKKIKTSIFNLNELVVLDAPLYHRLIPLNRIRKKMLKRIPESEQYLFPWYTEFIKFPEDALLIIIEKIAGTSLIETFFSIEDFNLLMRELQSDKPLFKFIKEKAEYFRLLPTAIEEAYAFRWLSAADKMVGSHRVSPQVWEMGLIGAAIRVTVKTILLNISSVEWRFRSAFCGTGLDDEQRFQLLKPIEIGLKEKPNFGWEGSFHLIEKWLKDNHKGIINDDDFANTFFKGWIVDLNAEAMRGFIPLFLEADIYWLLLTTANPYNLAKAIIEFDKSLGGQGLKNLSNEVLAICPNNTEFDALRNLSLFYSDEDESASLNKEDEKAIGEWSENLNHLGSLFKLEPPVSSSKTLSEHIASLVAHVLNKVDRNKIINLISTLKDRIVAQTETFWKPSEAGFEMGAADLPEQREMFYLNNGSIDISCDWYEQDGDTPPYINIKWKSEDLFKNELWIRFIHPETYKQYSEIYLGDLELEGKGEVTYSMKDIKFNPSLEKWAIIILLVEPK